jgi:hypothetical protein
MRVSRGIPRDSRWVVIMVYIFACFGQINIKQLIVLIESGTSHSTERSFWGNKHLIDIEPCYHYEPCCLERGIVAVLPHIDVVYDSLS